MRGRMVWVAVGLLLVAGTGCQAPTRPIVRPELAGDWTLRVQAYAYCDDLPPSARQRELPVHISRSGNELSLAASGSPGSGPAIFEAQGSIASYSLVVDLLWVDATGADRVEVKGRLAGFPEGDYVSGNLVGGGITVYPTEEAAPYNRCTTASFEMVRQR